MERKPRGRRPRPALEYGEQCSRCAAQLPSSATVCTVCGMTMAVPVQLPAPREAIAA